MKIRVRFTGISPSNAQEMTTEVERRARFALDRLAHSIRDVHVVLTDVNGPRGGVDQQCVLTIMPKYGGEPVVARALEESRTEAVVKSLKRARRRLELDLVRQRQRAS